MMQWRGDIFIDAASFRGVVITQVGPKLTVAEQAEAQETIVWAWLIGGCGMVRR